MDSLLLPTEEENSSWRIQDWHWDPYKMEAEPVERRPSSGSSRRQSRGPVICQVDGCGADLSGLKEYHQRYKICEYHLKVASIVKDGAQQRFCQQCGRFHVLSEFDGVKRSCRARLERHNARRRKKSDAQSPACKTSRTGIHSKEEKTPPSSGDYDMDVDMHANPACDPGSLSSGDPRVPDRQPCPSQRVTQPGTKDSLMQLEHLFYHEEDVPMGSEPPRPGVEGLPADVTAVRPQDEVDPVAEVFQNFAQSVEARELWQAMAVNDVHSREGNTTPSSIAVSQVLFPPTERGPPVRPVVDPVSMHAALPRLTTFPVATLGLSSAVPDYRGPRALTSPISPSLLRQNVSAAPEEARSARPEDAPGLQQASADVPPPGSGPVEMMDQRDCTLLYDSLLKLTSLSVKVFNCTPANLPPALRRELLNAVRGGLVPEGYMRPGCVQLTLDLAQQRTAGAPESVDSVVKRLLQGEASHFWKTHHLLVQLGDEVAIVHGGVVVQELSRADHPDLFPVLQRPSPICVSGNPGERFTLHGKHISGLQDTLLCRVQGHYVNIDVDCDAPEQVEGVETVECELVEECPVGAIRVEAAHVGTLSSGPLVILAVKDPEAVAEIRSLEMEQLSDECLKSFIHDMGRVLEFREWVLSRHGGPEFATHEMGMDLKYTTEEMVAIIQTARRLVAFACARTWTAVTEMILPVAFVGMESVLDVTSLVQPGAVDVIGLMRLAVASKKHSMVRFLRLWNAQEVKRSISESEESTGSTLPNMATDDGGVGTVPQLGATSVSLSLSSEPIPGACSRSAMGYFKNAESQGSTKLPGKENEVAHTGSHGVQPLQEGVEHSSLMATTVSEAETSGGYERQSNCTTASNSLEAAEHLADMSDAHMGKRNSLLDHQDAVKCFTKGLQFSKNHVVVADLGHHAPTRGVKRWMSICLGEWKAHKRNMDGENCFQFLPLTMCDMSSCVEADNWKIKAVSI